MNIAQVTRTDMTDPHRDPHTNLSAASLALNCRSTKQQHDLYSDVCSDVDNDYGDAASPSPAAKRGRCNDHFDRTSPGSAAKLAAFANKKKSCLAGIHTSIPFPAWENLGCASSIAKTISQMFSTKSQTEFRVSLPKT